MTKMSVPLSFSVSLYNKGKLIYLLNIISSGHLAEKIKFGKKWNIFQFWLVLVVLRLSRQVPLFGG